MLRFLGRVSGYAEARFGLVRFERFARSGKLFDNSAMDNRALLAAAYVRERRATSGVSRT